jgi:hypothetical protein
MDAVKRCAKCKRPALGALCPICLHRRTIAGIIDSINNLTEVK